MSVEREGLLYLSPAPCVIVLKSVRAIPSKIIVARLSINETSATVIKTF